ncbi:prephenate dehydrogenase [Nigerium massiliense]|uniref:prephenate dehydrogenase n=1 Tax=Nigerium massiliense TaxID=1522317 RepID=UPI0005906A0A|nr:prephenate dehydrogenase [Nigerium massiliense]
MIDVRISPVLIIGTGLVGASVGCALTRAGLEVHLQDASPTHALVAASRGAGTIDPIDPEDVNLVVVAAPPRVLAPLIEDALATYPNASVTDTGSIKGVVLAQLRAGGVDLSRYCGSHPMAGSQRVGPLTARADLFEERTWIVTPHDNSSAKAVLAVQRIADLCGARVISMAAGHHDEAVAQVSHVPQLMSALVGGGLLELPVEHLRLAGQGLRDVTRIAGSDPGMWTQIISANASAVRTELEELSEDLQQLISVLDDPAQVTAFLDRGRRGTRRLPGKHGALPADYAQVVVEIPDEPGALARLFSDIDKAGVNVEDVAIDHELEREVGRLTVLVDPGRAPSLRTAMQAAGWTVRD